VAGPVPRFSVTDCAAAPVGEIGADTEALLAELGYGPDDVLMLRKSLALG
jgi:hypothetical protein